jgi:RND family efflux transporter MFP subunit
MSRLRSKFSFQVLILLAGLVFMGGCSDKEVAEELQVARPVKTVVVSGSDMVSRQLPGRVQATNQVDLSFRVRGPLVAFDAKEGQEVRKGDVLARIDPRDYEIRLNAAQAQLVKAEADFSRLSALYEKEAVSVAELDQSRAARDLAGSDVDKARADLADTDLRAPMNSTIGKTFVENFQEVLPGKAILSLVDLSGLKIVVDVPETAIAQSSNDREKLGKLFARFDSAPGKEFPLTLLEVAAQADPATQTYAVTLAMAQPDGLTVRPGMTATVINIPTTTEAGSEIVIPAIAVFTDPAGTEMVWVVNPDTLTVSGREITAGDLRGADRIQIVAGLSAGDRIAVSAVTRLEEGTQISLMEQ